jgi:serine/threonine protein kinase
MRFYRGETLEQRLRRAPVGRAEGLDIAMKLAKGVAALHRAGVVHRDIKPDNVVRQPDGELRLIDLGVARLPNIDDFPASVTQHIAEIAMLFRRRRREPRGKRRGHSPLRIRRKARLRRPVRVNRRRQGKSTEHNRAYPVHCFIGGVLSSLWKRGMWKLHQNAEDDPPPRSLWGKRLSGR